MIIYVSFIRAHRTHITQCGRLLERHRQDRPMHIQFDRSHTYKHTRTQNLIKIDIAYKWRQKAMLFRDIDIVMN